MPGTNIYVITPTDEEPECDDIEYDYGETTFSTQKAAKRRAKELYPNGGYTIWKMPKYYTWYGSWERSEEVAS